MPYIISWVVIFEVFLGCHDFLILGLPVFHLLLLRFKTTKNNNAINVYG